MARVSKRNAETQMLTLAYVANRRWPIVVGSEEDLVIAAVDADVDVDVHAGEKRRKTSGFL